MKKKHELTTLSSDNLFSPKTEQPDIRGHFPIFTADSQPLVFIKNTRFDAKSFSYEKPYVILGKSGFLVDYGDLLGYFASTWQGQPNLSLRYHDFKLMLLLAQKRTLNTSNFNDKQMGFWDENWSIGGIDAALVEQLNKIRNDHVRNILS
jgi:hypothetical protein